MIISIARPILIPFAVFGIVANIFLFGSLLNDKHKRPLLSIMISVQACADFLLNVVYLWTSIGITQNGITCQIQGFSLILIFQCTLLHWWVISIIRVRYVIDSQETTRLQYFFLLLLSFIICLSFALFTLLTGNIEVGPAGFYCAPKWDTYYISIIACICVFCFNLHLVINYGRIYHYVKTNSREEHISTTRMLVFVIIFFEISIVPFWFYLVVRIIHITNNSIINIAYCEVIAYSLVAFNTSMNPLIVSMLSPFIKEKNLIFFNFLLCNFLTNKLNWIITDDSESNYEDTPKTINNNQQNIISQYSPNQKDFSENRTSELNEKTLSSSKSLGLNNDDDDDNNNITHVHGGLGISGLGMGAASPSVQSKTQMFDVQLDQPSTGMVGNYYETRPTTPTSSILDEKEHKEGI